MGSEMDDAAPRGGRWNLLLRLVLVGIALSALLFLPQFYEHVHAHFTGSISDDMVVGRWHVVVINIIIFISFLIPLSFRRKADWKEYTIVSAFIVSLFVEMYGAPLLVMMVAGRIAPVDAAPLETPVVVNFFGVELGLTVPMVYGVLLMALGTALILVGWYQLYVGVKERELVTNGVYSVSRNPQYLGFMIIIVGWWVGWPTVLVTVFAPILLFMYYRLCRVEEGEVGDLPGYEDYRRDVPLVI